MTYTTNIRTHIQTDMHSVHKYLLAHTHGFTLHNMTWHCIATHCVACPCIALYCIIFHSYVDTYMHTCMHTCIHAYLQTYRQPDRHADKHIYIYIYIHYIQQYIRPIWYIEYIQYGYTTFILQYNYIIIVPLYFTIPSLSSSDSWTPSPSCRAVLWNTRETEKRVRWFEKW